MLETLRIINLLVSYIALIPASIFFIRSLTRFNRTLIQREMIIARAILMLSILMTSSAIINILVYTSLLVTGGSSDIHVFVSLETIVFMIQVIIVTMLFNIIDSN